MAQEGLVTLKQLIEAGVHFGHQTQRWNPKMRRYIYGRRDGLYIIDVRKTVEGLERAYRFLEDLASRGGIVLFVGTKSQARDVIAEEAERLGMPYVNYRWLGGLLTNFETMRRRIYYMKELEQMEASGELDTLPKKEAMRLRREKAKLERNLGGIKSMERLPDALYVIDINREKIAVTEARRLGIPIVAIVDTNCDPDLVDYVIPGNDDAIRADALITRILADAIAAGREAFERRQVAPTENVGSETRPQESHLGPEVSSVSEGESSGAAGDSSEQDADSAVKGKPGGSE
jgi:small subunit ribosomal protein S2